MIHPATEVRFISQEKGYGLFATDFIPKGTITWVRDSLDREISPLELKSHPEEMREVILHYSYRNNRGNFIFCWDNTRYINHACKPNCSVTAYGLELAVRDIHKDDEITNHYGMLNIIEPFTLPGKEQVVICPDDLLRYGATWDALLCEVFPALEQLAQPLRRLIRDELWHELVEVSRGELEMRSVVTCYCGEGGVPNDDEQAGSYSLRHNLGME